MYSNALFSLHICTDSNIETYSDQSDEYMHVITRSLDKMCKDKNGVGSLTFGVLV